MQASQENSPLTSNDLQRLNPHFTEYTPLLAGPSSKPLRRRKSAARVDWSNPQECDRCLGDAAEPSYNSLERDSDLESPTYQRSSPTLSVSANNLRSKSPCSPSATLDGANDLWCSQSDSTSRSNPQQTLEPTSGDSVDSQYRRFLPNLEISLRLQNSGSVARDHLASERTFLAYMRTSLAIASSGVALVQLFSAASSSTSTPQGSVHRLHHYIRPLGASTIGVGLLVLLIGVVRYFKIQSALTQGYFPVARVATGFIAVMLTVLVTMTFAILLAGKLEVKGK